jgi:addiction module RelE/StbE family toxin
MTLIYTKHYERAYKKLSQAQREQANDAIRLFEKDPMTPALKNHLLKGQLKGIRSIKAGYDLRILYTEEGGHTVIFSLRWGHMPRFIDCSCPTQSSCLKTKDTGEA